MRLIKNKTTMLLAGLACMMLSVAANADVIVNSFGMKYSAAPTGWVYYSGTSPHIYAGEIALQTDGGPLDAFCIDVTQVLRAGSYSQNNDAPGPGLNFGLIGKLYDHYYAGANTASSSAAFQLALWAIVNGSSTSQSSSFGTGGSAAATANTWLGSLGDLNSLGHYQFTVLEPLSPVANQRLLTAVRVPEPGSLVLLGLGVLGAGAARRFRKH